MIEVGRISLALLGDVFERCDSVSLRTVGDPGILEQMVECHGIISQHPLRPVRSLAGGPVAPNHRGDEGSDHVLSLWAGVIRAGHARLAQLPDPTQ